MKKPLNICGLLIDPDVWETLTDEQKRQAREYAYTKTGEMKRFGVWNPRTGLYEIPQYQNTPAHGPRQE